MPNRIFRQYLQKGLKQKKKNITIESCTIKLVWIPNLSLNKKFWFFETNLLQKGVSLKNKKSEHHHWSLPICVRLSTIFQLKLAIFIFWTKLAQKRVSTLNRCKEHGYWVLHISINQCIKFFLQQTNLNFETKGAKLKNWTSALNSAYYNFSKYQIPA